MSEQIPILFSEAFIMTAVEAELNRTFFKQHPMKVIGIEPAEMKGVFVITAKPLTNGEPRVSKPKKEPKMSKRGLAKLVLEHQTQEPNGSMEPVA